MTGTTPPSTGNRASSSQDIHSCPDNGDVYPSSPPLNETAYDGDPFNDFDPYLANLAEQQNSSDEQPDQPEDRSQSSPQPTTPYQLPSFPSIVELGAGEPDPFCQIDQLTTSRLKQDALTQLINGAPAPQSRGVANDLLDAAAPPLDSVISQEIRRQRTAINAPRTQASQYPVPTPTHDFDNGYEELSMPGEMVSGRGGYAPAPASNPFASSGPLRFDSRQNMFAQVIRGTIYDTNINTAPVNQRAHEGYMAAQDVEDDDEESPEPEDEESSERQDTPTANRTTRRRRSGPTYVPRARGNRRHPPRSDAHLRFSSTDPVALADADHTHTIDRKHHSGRNLMALFDDSDTPRTRYRLRIEGGRTGTHASSAHRDSDQEIPARLALREICQRFPNHVWGTGLRLFMHEYITAEQIWKWLPDSVRMNGCKGRPHNYLQQAIGRQCDEMMLEETGETRKVIKRTHDDDEDEDKKEKKPIKKGKLTHTPGGHQMLAPAPGANQQPFPQRSPTSPFVAQTQQGRVGPRGVIQRPDTNTTPVPAARAPSPDAPSPPRTAQDLRRLIATELAMQDDIARPQILAQYGAMSPEDVQGRLRAWHFNTDGQLIGRVLRAINFVANPLGNNDVMGLMHWFLSRRPDARVPQAVPLAHEDTDSLALNWYLYMLREVTVKIGKRRVAVEEADEA